MTYINPAQCRAARSLLNWSQSDLAKASPVATKTISDFEKGARTPLAVNLVSIKNAFETAGVIFLADGENITGGPGVRLK